MGCYWDIVWFIILELQLHLVNILLSSLNSFQLSGLLYLGSGIVIIPTIIKKFIGFSKNNNSKNNSIIKKDNKYNKEIFTYSLKKGIGIKFNKNFIYILLIILFGGILGPLFLMIGLSHTTATSTAIWLNMELVVQQILGIVLFKITLINMYIGLMFTFLAGASVSWNNGFGDIFSIIFIILACFSWGVDNQLTPIVDGYSPEVITFVKGIFGGGINFTIGMLIPNQFIPLDIIFME